MFNEELKSRFISEKYLDENSQVWVKGLFDRTEPFEEKCGKDLCALSDEEFVEAFNGITGIRNSGREIILRMLRNYVSWCIDNDVPNTRPELLEVDGGISDKIKAQTVGNPTHLQRWLDFIFVPEKDETLDNVNRAYCWLAYSGIRENEAFEVQDSDVDFENMVIHLHGKEYPIYREGIPALRNCKTHASFIYDNPRYEKPIYKDRLPGHDLLRACRGGANNIMSMRTMMNRRIRIAMKKCEDETVKIRLTYFRIWMSGLFYRMYEAERAGMPVDFSGVVKEDLKIRAENGGDIQDRFYGSMRNSLIKNYIKDYEDWKETYAG